MDGGGVPSARLPATDQAARVRVRWRTSELPDALRTTLLVAASDDGDEVTEVLGAASLITGHPVVGPSLDPGISAGLVEIDGTRSGSTILWCAPRSTNRRMTRSSSCPRGTGGGHRRSAGSAAWHRAASIVEPNESVASELEAAAMSAPRRGGVAVAVAALERAAQLSEDIEDRSRRLLLCAQLAFELGRPEVVDRLLSEAESLDVGEAERARLTWLREMHEEDPSGGAVRVRSLVGFRPNGSGWRSRSRDFLRAAALRCYWADPGEEARDLVVAAAERATDTGNDPSSSQSWRGRRPSNEGDTVLARIAGLVGSRIDLPHHGLVGGADNSLGLSTWRRLTWRHP